MWRIFQFLIKYGNIILFLTLEIVALLIVINLNEKQNRLFGSFSLEVSGGIHNFNNSVVSYFNLRDENEKLQLQNREIQKQLLSAEAELQTLNFKAPKSSNYTLVPDSLLPVQSYDFIPCRAINNSIDKNYNYITLNKGSDQGAEKGMGLISPEGVAGTVIGVSPHFSIALSVLNKKFKLSTRLLNNRNIGTLSWSGFGPEYGNLEFIPQTSPLKVGDTIVTSGFSTIFSENFMVGIVDSYDEENRDGFYNIKVKLATNYRKLDALYLVRNIYRTEIDSLEAGITTP